MSFIGNFTLFPVVKEFWKSVEIWQSYRHEFGGSLFGTRCIYIYYIILIFLPTAAAAGDESPDELMQVMMPVFENEICNQPTWYDHLLDDSMVCAGYEESGRSNCRVSFSLLCVYDTTMMRSRRSLLYKTVLFTTRSVQGLYERTARNTRNDVYCIYSTRELEKCLCKTDGACWTLLRDW